MREQYNSIAFTPSVAAEQERYGSRIAYARQADPHEKPDPGGMGRDEVDFLSAQDGFYLATVSETGWPYVQYRGGPAGFLKVLGPRTLGWADFRGNRQYISIGNVAGNARASIIVMDYARRARIKFFGTLTVDNVRDDQTRADALKVPGYKGIVERAVQFDVAGFDWNCPQHITLRYSEDQIANGVARLYARIEALEAEVAALKS
ncbi:MAG: pyridoxamine 5'-phosphate oxidase family protein [Pseudomonadota bacterium]